MPGGVGAPSALLDTLTPLRSVLGLTTAGLVDAFFRQLEPAAAEVRGGYHSSPGACAWRMGSHCVVGGPARVIFCKPTSPRTPLPCAGGGQGLGRRG